jgi:uncharacterized protein (TIGR00730 family)
MKPVNSVAVYCSASANIDEEYLNQGKILAKHIVKHGMRLVYGGGHVGLMGAVADGVMAEGGEVFGVTTKHLDQYEVGHQGVTELKIVDDMHARKNMMFEEADGFIIMPGGFGTLEELFEVLTWKQIGLHDKPIVLVNINGFWDPLKKLMKSIVDKKFASSGDDEIYHFVDDIEKAVSQLVEMPRVKINPSKKWIRE